LSGFLGIESILTTPRGQGVLKRGSSCNKSFKKMFWKKAEGGMAACHILHKWAISSSTAPCGQGAHKGVSICNKSFKG
jgi:hypothetical protein